jgi:hypothetical protein
MSVEIIELSSRLVFSLDLFSMPVGEIELSSPYITDINLESNHSGTLEVESRIYLEELT